MKIKTSGLSGAALDWAVAKCENVPVRFSVPHEQLLVVGYPYMVWQPHANWSQGGPIIEREKIDLYQSTGRNAAAMWENLPGGGRLIAESKDTPTILTAALRCYVASKLGDEVEIPDELTGE